MCINCSLQSHNGLHCLERVPHFFRNSEKVGNAAIAVAAPADGVKVLRIYSRACEASGEGRHDYGLCDYCVLLHVDAAGFKAQYIAKGNAALCSRHHRARTGETPGLLHLPPGAKDNVAVQSPRSLGSHVSFDDGNWLRPVLDRSIT